MKHLFFYNPDQQKIISFKCLAPLDTKSNGCSDGTNVQLWYNWNYDSQAWNLDYKKKGYQTIKRKSTECNPDNDNAKKYMLSSLDDVNVELEKEDPGDWKRNRMWKIYNVTTEAF